MAGSDDKLVFDGIVKAECGNGVFSVEVQDLKDNPNVLCHLSGKIKMNNIKIAVADKVKIEVSVYDTSKGRITYRSK